MWCHASCRHGFQAPSHVNTKGTTGLIKILLGYIVLYWYKIVSVFIVNLERVIYTCAVWLIGNALMGRIVSDKFTATQLFIISKPLCSLQINLRLSCSSNLISSVIKSVSMYSSSNSNKINIIIHSRKEKGDSSI